jgi:hypothetical protein
MLAPRALALIPGLPATDVEGIDPPSPTRLWCLAICSQTASWVER